MNWMPSVTATAQEDVRLGKGSDATGVGAFLHSSDFWAAGCAPQCSSMIV